jgi:hypothetical protein
VTCERATCLIHEELVLYVYRKTSVSKSLAILYKPFDILSDFVCLKLSCLDLVGISHVLMRTRVRLVLPKLLIFSASPRFFLHLPSPNYYDDYRCASTARWTRACTPTRGRRRAIQPWLLLLFPQYRQSNAREL